MTEYSAIFGSPVTTIGIVVKQEKLTGVDFLRKAVSPRKPRDALSREVIRQLRAYFTDPAFRFDLPLNVQGTAFQCAVWDALREIKAGETQRYGELAAHLNTGARAVGNACRWNPLILIIPCHRVVSTSGLGGYAGHTQGEALRRKRWLLTHENARIS